MTRHARHLACALLTAAAMAGGCEPIQTIDRPATPKVRREMTVTVVNELAVITDRSPVADDPLIYDAQSRTVKMFAAANETVAWQLALDAPTGARKVRVTFNDLVGPQAATVAAANFTAFDAVPVNVTDYPAWYLRLVDRTPQPARFFDALAPLAADKGLTLRKGQRRVLWIDLRVPPGTRAGTYRGAMTVSQSGKADIFFTVELKVYGFVLPDARPLAAVGGFDHRTLFKTFVQRDGQPFVPVRMDLDHPLVARGLGIMRQLMVLAHDHRLDLFETSLHPVLKRDARARAVLDWREYDAIVLPYVNGTAFADRVAVPVWPVPFSDHWPDPRTYGGADSDVYRTTASQVLAAGGQHLRKVVTDPGRLVVWPRRGPISKDAYEEFVAAARLVRGADALLPILSSLPVDPPQMTGWTVPQDFAKLVDIQAPAGEFLSPRAAGGDRLWFTPGLPPYTPSLGVLATGADVCAIPWFAVRYRLDALMMPEVLNWTGDPFATSAGAEARLFYPGTAVGHPNRVLPSVRLKRLRRGLQDATYLWLLRQRRRGDVADTISRAIVRYAGLEAAGDHYLDPRLDGWVQQPATWVAARRLMADELQAAIVPPPANSHFEQVRRLNWREFEEKVYSVRVEQVRTRVRRADDGKLRATMRVELYNEYPRDVQVSAALGRLPEGWHATGREARLAAMAPGRRDVLELTAVGDGPPAGDAGKAVMGVQLSVDRGRPRTVVVSAPYLVAQKPARAVTVDGSLEDWPVQPISRAGDFVLIGRRGRSDPLAKRQTLAQAMCDGRNLYLAVRCDEPRPRGLVARSDNTVRYQQLIPAGEDLVEVILDPGLQAVATSDLFHIVVKANGVVIAERGVNCRPPLGPWSPWPAGVKAAVRRGAADWTAEIAIPIAAFGGRGAAAQWGVNFTRFATAGGEASSWSGAARYFYDPQSLGTMFVPALATPTR